MWCFKKIHQEFLKKLISRLDFVMMLKPVHTSHSSALCFICRPHSEEKKVLRFQWFVYFAVINWMCWDLLYYLFLCPYLLPLHFGNSWILFLLSLSTENRVYSLNIFFTNKKFSIVSSFDWKQNLFFQYFLHNYIVDHYCLFWLQSLFFQYFFHN